MTLRRVRGTIVAVKKKTTIITYYEYVFVALGMQDVKGRSHVLIYGPSGSTIFFHVIS